MSTKKFKKAGGMAILGLIVLATGALAQTAGDQLQMRTQTRTQARAQFLDQNGDGINDCIRDHDGDGIPNRQDPDWTRPQDGTGMKNQFGRKSGEGWSRGSFQGQQGPFGTGVCDGTGPKGKAKGRRIG